MTVIEHVHYYLNVSDKKYYELAISHKKNIKEKMEGKLEHITNLLQGANLNNVKKNALLMLYLKKLLNTQT